MTQRILLRILLVLPLVVVLSSMSQKDEWVPLLDKDLSQWETYLSYKFPDGYNGKVPEDASGKPLKPVGYNRDSTHVFSVINEQSGPVLRVSGEIYGCVYTRKAYRNYHLKLQVKWGQDKYEPRKTKLRDSGILYHSIGDAGVEYWRSWMLSQEFQVMEGHMGDFWCQATSMVDIRSIPSEGMINMVADQTQPFRTCKRGGDFYCMRSGNYESKPGEWTTLELICFEGKSLHIVNGHVVMVLQKSRYSQPDGVEVPLESGKIQLQSESAEVYYRDIRIKELKSMPKEYQALFL